MLAEQFRDILGVACALSRITRRINPGRTTQGIDFQTRNRPPTTRTPGNCFDVATAFKDRVFRERGAGFLDHRQFRFAADKSRTTNSSPRISANSRVLWGLRVARRRGCTLTGFTGLTGLESTSGAKRTSILLILLILSNSFCMNERRKPYPFDQLEPKWQTIWDETRAFHAPNPGEQNFDPAEAEILRARHVPLPERRRSARRPSGGLHRHRHHRALQTAAAASTCFIPMGWDAFGLAGRAIRHQDRAASGHHHARERREVQDAAQTDRVFLRLGTRGQHDRSGYFKWTQWIFLQIYNSWFNPETKKAEPISTYRGDDPDSVRLAYVAEVAGELVS